MKYTHKPYYFRMSRRLAASIEHASDTLSACDHLLNGIRSVRHSNEPLHKVFTR
jgi:hypothetical protein